MNRSAKVAVVFVLLVGGGCSRDLGGAIPSGDADADSPDASVDADGCTGEAPDDCVQTCGTRTPIPRICAAGSWTCPGSYLPQAIAYNNDNCCPRLACLQSDGRLVSEMCYTGARLCPSDSIPVVPGTDAAVD